MLTQRFHGLFKDLVGSFKVYKDATRDPARILELTSARADLDDARVEIFEESRGVIRELRTLRLNDPQAYAEAMRGRSTV
jgi:hypothetical protein